MKPYRKFLILFFMLSFFAKAENEDKPLPTTTNYLDFQRKLATLDKGKHSLKNILKVIDLLRFNLHRDEFKSVPHGVPAVGYIVASYDEDISPLLLQYSLEIEDVYLKRRAVFCIESIEGVTIQGYLDRTFGSDASAEKFEQIKASSFHHMLEEAEALKKAGKFREHGVFLGKYLKKFYRSSSSVIDDLLNAQ